MPLARVVPGPRKTAPEKRVDQRTPVTRRSVRAKRELPSRAVRREGCSAAVTLSLDETLAQPSTIIIHAVRLYRCTGTRKVQ